MTERRLQRKSMRLARHGPDGIPGNVLALHLMYASAAKPGWRSRNWIMSQAWFDACLPLRWTGDDPGMLFGITISVDDDLGGFPRIERYLRKPR